MKVENIQDTLGVYPNFDIYIYIHLYMSHVGSKCNLFHNNRNSKRQLDVFIPGSALIAEVRSATKCVGNLDGCKEIPNEHPGQQTVQRQFKFKTTSTKFQEHATNKHVMILSCRGVSYGIAIFLMTPWQLHQIIVVP